MGWTYTHRQSNKYGTGETLRDFFAREFCGDAGRHEIVMFATHGWREAYAVMHTLADDHYFGVILLLDNRRNDHYNFGYKDMDESMGPCAANAPRNQIDFLNANAPLDDTNDPHGYARNWRAACLENAEKRSRARSLKTGDVLTWDPPVRTTLGPLTSATVEKRGRRTILRSGYSTYKLPADTIAQATVTKAA